MKYPTEFRLLLIVLTEVLRDYDGKIMCIDGGIQLLKNTDDGVKANGAKNIVKLLFPEKLKDLWWHSTSIRTALTLLYSAVDVFEGSLTICPGEMYLLSNGQGWFGPRTISEKLFPEPEVA